MQCLNLFLALVVVTAGCGAASVQNHGVKSVLTVEPVSHPERVVEMHKVIDLLLFHERQVIAPLVEEHAKILHPTREAIRLNFLAVEKQCGSEYRRDHALTEEESQWCSDQAEKLAKKMQDWTHQNIDHCFKRRAAYMKWFELVNPLMVILTEEHQDRTKYGVTLVHAEQMKDELLRLLREVHDFGTNFGDVTAWQDTLRSYGNLCDVRAQFVDEINETWRAIHVAVALSYSGLLALKLVIEPSMVEIEGVIRRDLKK